MWKDSSPPRRIAALALGILGAGLLYGASDDPAHARGHRLAKASAGDELFAPTHLDVPRIQIDIPAAALDKLRGRGWGWGGRERPEVQVTVREGGQVYTNVALHLKGSAGSFQPVEAKPALTLNFDKHAKGQAFHGLTKISLNNSVQDPSYMSEKICRELFNAAGVPAPRADFATVELNGRRLGLYVLLEGYNRQFLKRHFKNTRGNLYDGGFLKDIDSTLNVNSGDNRKDESDLKALAAAARESNPTLRFARLEKVLDMDRFVTFIAMEVMVCHWDGYAMNKNNYRVYHDLDTDRILFMPHGMDQMFGVMMADSTMKIRPAMQGLVARALMDTTEGRRRFYRRLAELNSSLFNLQTITNQIYDLSARLEPVLTQLSASAAEEHQAEVAKLCDRIALRKQSLDDQLSGAPGKTLAFDSTGTARLSEWVGLTNYGRPLLTREAAPDGKPLLHISAAQGNSIGSWRAKVSLEDGHYSFEARVQTREVATDPDDFRAGAGLRIAGHPAAKKEVGDSSWTDMAYEFDVPDGIHEVDLVCELRAAKGEVWFDAESLRLVRK
jgi:spore coat protein H